MSNRQPMNIQKTFMFKKKKGKSRKKKQIEKMQNYEASK